MSLLGLEPEFLRKLERMSLAVKKTKTGRSQGGRRSLQMGSSPEFLDFRDYTAGDDLRRVDWNAYARLSRMFLKLFTEERDATFHMLIDQSASMTFGTGQKHLFAIRCAAALSYIALQNLDRASVGLLGDGLKRSFGPVQGKNSWMRLWAFLAENMDKDGDPATDLERAAKEFCSKRPAPGVCVLLSDLLTGGFRVCTRLLQAAGNQVIVIQILGPADFLLDEMGDVRLLDSETRQARELALSPSLVRAYTKKVEDYVNTSHEYCTSRGIGHISVMSDEPFEDFFLRTLVSFGLLR